MKNNIKEIQGCIDDLTQNTIILGVIEHWAKNLYENDSKQDLITLKKALTGLTGYAQVDHIVQFSVKYGLDLRYILFDGNRRKRKSKIEKDLASYIKITCKENAMAMFEAWLKEFHDFDINSIKLC